MSDSAHVPSIPDDLLTDVRLIAEAAILDRVDRLARAESAVATTGLVLVELSLLHRVWIRSSVTDDYDPGSWASYYHHPEHPTVTDVQRLLTLVRSDERLWGCGLDLITAVERVQAALRLD